MNVHNTMVVLALLVGLIWMIISCVVFAVHYYSENQKCKLKTTSKSETLIMKSENDTTNYFDDNESDCLCKSKIYCVRKCCPSNKTYRNGKCIPDDGNYIFSEFFPYYITENVSFNQICQPGWSNDSIELDFFLSPEEFIEDISSMEYCLYRNISIHILICNENKDDESIQIGLRISITFLLITFVVYILLPDKNNHRKSVISYVFSLIVGFTTLILVKLVSREDETICFLFAYSRVFFIIASFFWLNAICMEMWLTFCGVKMPNSNGRNEELKEFITYSIYAWGMPLLLNLFMLLTQNFVDKKSIFYPNIGGQGKCSIGDEHPNLLYFYLPMGILVTINIALCVLITMKILGVNKESRVFKRKDSKVHCSEENKRKFKLYVKLTLAMGVNWSLEVISWLVEWYWKYLPDYIFYASDVANAAYGVCIFFIFVFNKNIWLQLRKRYYILRGKPHLAHTMSGSRSTTKWSNNSTSGRNRSEKPVAMNRLSSFQ